MILLACCHVLMIIIESHMVSEVAWPVMASNAVLQHPPTFDFKAPDGWLRWKRRYLQFQEATGLEEGRQVSTLLYWMGEEANDVLTFTNISEEDAKKFDLVVAALMSILVFGTTSFLKEPGLTCVISCQGRVWRHTFQSSIDWRKTASMVPWRMS